METTTKDSKETAGATVAPRLITSHKLNGLNDALFITALDAPGNGGANHKYRISLYEPATAVPSPAIMSLEIDFQNGPILEAGFNGVSNEALLAILIDRMQGFQSGPYKSRDNACALTHLEEAMMWLQKRTRDRMARGVEGTHKV